MTAKPNPDEAEAPLTKAASTWIVPVITAAILAGAFLAYYFVYVNARREYITNRNFRALALLGEQIRQSASIHGNILDFCAELLAEKKQAAHLKKLGKDSFLIVHHEDEKLDPAEREHEALNDYLKFLAPSFELTKVKHEPSGAAGLHVERRNDRWELVLRTFQQSAAMDYQGSLKIDELMEPLVASLPFDDVLLVSEEGLIVFQSNNTGPRFTTLSSLLQAQTGAADAKPEAKAAAEGKKPESPKASEAGPVNQNTDPAWRARSMHLTELTLAGTRYKLFLQPLLISSYVSKAETKAQPASEFILCGLRTSSALDWEALSLSYTFFIWFTVGFFVIWTSYKALKILFMNHRERLRLRELGTLGLSLVLLTSVLTISSLQAGFRRNDDTEEQLQRLSQQLSANIHDELQQMRAQLFDWCGSGQQGVQSDLKAVAAEHREVIRNSNPEGRSPRGKLILHTPPQTKYPFVSNTFWTDDDKHQIVKWSATQYVTPMIDVSELPVFRTPAVRLEGDSTEFQFASILPPNKLEYLAILSMKTGDCVLASPSKVLDSGLKDSADIVEGWAALTAQPMSLIDPILPKGYGFAVVDSTGAVLFHSDKSRNGRENFLVESDDSKELYAAVFGHTSPRPISIKYMGRDHRALVTPLEKVSHAPWSLVVFRDLTAYRTLNLQVMTVALTLLFVTLAGPVIVILIRWAVLRPRFAPEWLWPNRGRIETYSRQVFIYALLIVLFLAAVSLASTEVILFVCAAVPYVVLALTWWCFRKYRPAVVKPHARPEDVEHGPGPAPEPLAYRTRYLAAVLLLLLLIGVLTPMALFRASLDLERRLEIKQGQLYLASALSQRWISIVKQHDNEELSDAAWRDFQADPRTWHWIVPGYPASPNTLASAGQPAAAEHFSGWLRRLLYSFHHDYNDASAEMLGVIQDHGNPSDWSWDHQASTLTLQWRGPHPPLPGSAQAGAPLLLSSAVPGFSWGDGVIYALIAVLVLAASGGILLAVAHKLFLFDVAPLKITGTRRVAESLREGRNLLILLPEVSDWHLDIPRKTIDVSMLKTMAEWAEAARDLLSAPQNILVELLNFEYHADDPDVDSQKFVVLDLLLKAGTIRVAVVMRVPVSSEDYRSKFPTLDAIDLRDEPFSWWKQYEGTAQELISRECVPLPALWPLGAQLAKDLREEATHTEDTIASEILERADAYYKMIWNECSNDQKFVLSQLAADGVLNPTNGRAIRQMIRRGLITKDPQFRIMNESFRRFLRSATTRQMKVEWLNESRRSGWGRMHGAFFTSMTLVGVFLLATQNALWQSAAAYVTTALGGLGTLTKLFETLRDKATPEKG